MSSFGRSTGNLVKLLYSRSGRINQEQLDLAVSYVDGGGVVAVPTDTIYGFAAKANDTNALKRIFEIKGRGHDKPLAVCVSNLDEIASVAQTSSVDRNVLSSLLPGPLTILLKRSESLNKDLNPGVGTVGVRIPNHNFILALSHVVGPLALTSANKSGDPSPLVVEDFGDLWPQLDCIFDCGITRGPIKYDGPNRPQLDSTVIDLSEPGVYRIIRKGCSLDRTINVMTRFGYRKAKETTNSPRQ